MKIPQDVIIQVDPSGNFVIYNVFTHNTIAVEGKVLEILGCIEKGDDIKKFNKDEFAVWEIGYFSNTDGLLADPTQRIRDFKDWPKPKRLNAVELIDILKKSHIVIEDETSYSEAFSSKKSLFDKQHLGNFHQQLGQSLMIDKRADPEDWWAKQKFTSDYRGLNNTLYKSIQENFLIEFFKKFKSEQKILDLGCGVGYYTSLMGKHGATVLGIDPSDKYINIANKNNSSKNVSFKKSDAGLPGSLDWIPSNTYDYIFMSDALLFYFVSPVPNTKYDIKLLLKDIKRILKPNGRFISMEPNGIYFLRPWLGEEQRPFTIITEHRNKFYNIAPHYQEIIKAFIENGFSLKDIKDIYVNEDFSKTNKRAASFTKEFPIWSLFEIEPEK